MELTEALKLARNPEKIIDPQACNYASALVAGWIMDLEEQAFQQEIAFLQTEEDIFKKCNGVNATAKRQAKLTQDYRALQTTKLEIKKYRLLKGILRERFIVLTQTKKY